ncbi:hypothetical protein SCA6_013937 [Theobroma cacao]
MIVTSLLKCKVEKVSLMVDQIKLLIGSIAMVMVKDLENDHSLFRLYKKPDLISHLSFHYI